MVFIYLVVSCAFGAALGQIDTNNLLGSNPVSLPPNLAGKFNVSDTEVENIKNKYIDQFKKKCEQNGHPEIFDNAQNALTTFMNCYNGLVDVNVLQEEIEAAKPNGQVDEVFKKYCNKSPQFKTCFQNFTESVKPCFSADEQKNFKTVYNVTEQLAEFICYKDGDRIALFIAEGGKECFEEKQVDVQNCFSKVYDSETKQKLENITTFEGIMELEFKEKQCNQMADLQKCVVSVLENCAKPTSANIVDSLFNFVRKATPCKAMSKMQKEKATASANGISITVSTIITAVATALLL